MECIFTSSLCTTGSSSAHSENNSYVIWQQGTSLPLQIFILQNVCHHSLAVTHLWLKIPSFNQWQYLVYHNIEQMPKKLDQQLGLSICSPYQFLLISISIFWFNSFSLSYNYMGLVGMDNNGPQTSWTGRMVSKRNYGNCFIW
jgi:hypothetical protein